MYVLRLPSVTTWTQSSFRVVMGHLHSAPERLVPGCKFWSSGAPTSNLLSKHKQERKKNDGVNISSKYGRASGRVCTFFFHFYFRVHPYTSIHRATTKKKRTLEKGSLNHYTDKHTAPKDCHRPSLSSECCPGGEREMGCIIILIPPDHEILSPSRQQKRDLGKKDIMTCNYATATSKSFSAISSGLLPFRPICHDQP